LALASASERALRACAASLAAALLPSAGACARATPATPPNVLLVSIDTVRADHVGAYGYAPARTPTLDRLAARGARYERASTVTPLTLPAHTSLLTGLTPIEHGVRDNGGFYLDEKFDTLAEILKRRGYRTGAFVGSFVLDSRWGLNQGFDLYFDNFDLSRDGEATMDDIQRRGEQVADRAIDWLRLSPDRRFFAWLHFYDPHTPYDAPPPFPEMFPRTLVGAYDAEIAYTDAQLGRVVSELGRLGVSDRTLIVVTGDHGESLGEHGEQTHGFFIYDATMHIPIIAAGPGIAAGVVSTPASIADIFPLVLRAVGVPDARPPAAAYGESYYPRFHYGWSELKSIRDDRYKFVLAPRPELYDLQQDRGEWHNLAAEQPQRAQAMAAALARLASDTAVKPPTDVDPDARARLQSLGYIGTASSLAGSAGSLADPKDKIGLYSTLKEALLEKQRGNTGRSIEMLQAAVDRDPRMIEGYSQLGSVLLDTGRFDEAATAFRRALALDPEHRGATYNLALADKGAGRSGDAEAGFERARVLDPRDGKPRWQLADIWMQARDFERARTLLEESLQLNVDRPVFLLKLAECLIELGRLDDAERRVREAIGIRPHQPRASYALGLVLEARHDVAGAQRAYEAELAANPKTWSAAFNLGKLHLAAGKPMAAARAFHHATSVEPAFAANHVYLAKALLDAGDLPGAEGSAREGLTRVTGRNRAAVRSFAHYILADVYSRLNRPRDAEREAALAEGSR
jgi:arylsulfatase A-like enzyme/Tfp pilus assembly protein PilF